MIGREEKEKLIKFIYSHEQSEGGFSFSQSTPATLEDTYFALRLLEELEEHSIKESTISYIQSLDIGRIKMPKHLYWIISMCRIVNLKDKIEELKDVIVHNNKFFSIKTLDDLYYNILAKDLYSILAREAFHSLFTLTKNEKEILRLAQRQNVKSMEEYKQIIILSKKLNLHFQQQNYIKIIELSQNPDGGFGIIPNSTSFLEPTYHALKDLREMNTKPKNIDACERFILSCKSKSGGFGRQGVTVPNLEYSYYAITSLKILESMKEFLNQ